MQLPRRADVVSRARARRAALALVIAAPLLRPGPAAATTFVRMDAGDLAEASVVAVIGTVTAVRNDRAGNGAITTSAIITPERVVAGTLPPGELRVREQGGSADGRTERVFGAADYQVGERVLAFLSSGPDGSLHTTAMAMGKYRLSVDGNGAEVATRVFDGEVAVLDPTSGKLEAAGKLEVESLAAVLARVGERTGNTPHASLQRVPRRPQATSGADAAFTYLGDPSRWFEPDDGHPVLVRIDPNGDAAIGPDDSYSAAVSALNAWSNVDGTALVLQSGQLDGPLPFDGCDGATRIVFNDPFNEIDPPVDCHGVLGVGGYCYVDEHRTVNGQSFLRIGLGKITIGDGWAGCPFWNPCNLAEVLTHEVGHAIGLGHSADPGATMAPTAQFDGRCASLAADDIDGVRFIYPPPDTPAPRPTSTRPPGTATHSPTIPPRATPTPRPLGAYSVGGRIDYYASGLPVVGASVSMRGANAIQFGGTAGDGSYAFDHLTDTAWRVEPMKSGEIADAVSALDAAWVLQAVAGLRTLSTAQRVACNVTGSGGVSALDAVRILQFKVGELARFPAAQQCGSDWLFFPAPAALRDQVVTVPAVDNQSCQRGSITFDPLGADAADANFQALVFGDCTANWLAYDRLRSVEPIMAPRGTALIIAPLQRQPGGRWRQPIGIRAPTEVHALDLDLRYDPDRLDLARVRAVRLSDPALAYSRSPQPGRVLISVASAPALPADGGPIVVIDFAARAAVLPPNLVRAASVSVDDGVVPWP